MSFHNGSGIKFYEPGSDYQHVSHRFADSRGVDVWTIGQATVLPELFHAYTGNGGINAAAGNDGSNDVLISGDNQGILKKITLSGDSTASTGNYVKTATSFPDGHSGTNYPFYSVTTDGTNYYAACARAVHRGVIGTLDSDTMIYSHSTTDVANRFIKYAKGYLLFGYGRKLTILDANATTSNTHTTGTVDIPTTNEKSHLNSSWTWNDATAGPAKIYVSGYAGNNSEIWAVSFDDTTNTLDLAGAVMVSSMPDGEIVNAIHFYLGHLAVGTNRGIRIAEVDVNGNLIMGPLLLESKYSVNGFTERDSFIYAATKVDAGAYTHGCLVRVDLANQFDDGTFAYAYDLEYRSSVNVDNVTPFTPGSSNCTEIYQLGGRFVLVTEESDSTTKGELQVEYLTKKRDTAWLQTGKIRYNTIEPKWFRYINVQCTTGQGDTLTISTIDNNNTEAALVTIGQGLSNQDIFISNPESKQETMAFKFTLNNASDDASLPVLKSYQIKALPTIRRQRLIQYPLSCFDVEMDKYNAVYGYSGRAMEIIDRLESLESESQFVSITDYRTGETYIGIIEEVRFTNESSPDKNRSGFGGTLIVTIRRM
jgi:hypothetical protein